MEALTQKQVSEMNETERKESLNYNQDLACNIDYVLEPLKSDIVQRNINLLESKILHNEY